MAHIKERTNLGTYSEQKNEFVAAFSSINERPVDDISLEFFYKPHTITLLAVSIASVIYTAFVRSDTEYSATKRDAKGAKKQKRNEFYESDEDGANTSGIRHKPTTSNKRVKTSEKIQPAEQHESDEDIAPKKSKQVSKPSLKRKAANKKPVATKSSALFESDSEDEAAIQRKTGQEVLQSALTRRVADGVLRRTANLDGDVFIDLKVYNTADIVTVDPKDRWQYAIISLKYQTDSEGSEVGQLKNFIKKCKSLFTEEGTFFSNKKF